MPTLSSFLSDHKPLIANKKLKVREFDEEPKGHFVSFVDEGNESFDVQIIIGTKEELEKYDCDCDLKKPCRHQVFLADFILSKEKTVAGKTPRKSTKKIPEYYKLIDSIDELALRDWLKNQLDENKALRLEFTHKFKEKTFTLESVEIDLLTAIKTATNSKKNLDQSQIKALLDLFEKINTPLYQYLEELSDIQTAILLIDKLCSICFHHYDTINSKSKKYEYYLKSLLPRLNNKFIPCTEVEFQKAIDLILKKSFQGNSISLRHIEYLTQLADLINESKVEILFSKIFEVYKQKKMDGSLLTSNFQTLLLSNTLKHGLFNIYYQSFSIIPWNNSYNIELIESLISINQLDQAAEFCHTYIKTNFNVEFNIPYFIQLREIYKQKNDKINYHKVIRELLPFSFNFSDYLEIKNSIADVEEAKKFRNKIYTRAKTYSAKPNHPCFEFCYKLLIEENKHNKLAELVERRLGNLQIINKYFDQVKIANDPRLLEYLLEFKSNDFYSMPESYEQEEKAAAEELATKIVSNFSTDVLGKYIKQIESKQRFYRMPFHTELVKNKF